MRDLKSITIMILIYLLPLVFLSFLGVDLEANGDTGTSDTTVGTIVFKEGEWSWEDPTKTDITWVVEVSDSQNLVEWFEDLSLDEKVAIYRWWKYKSVKLKIVTEYGELFIRLDKEE